MVRKLTALFALIFTMSLVAIPAASAQDIDTEGMSDLGLENAYLRMYMGDPSSGALGVMVAGFQFDEADTAADSFEDFTCGFAGGFMGAEDATDCDGLVDAGFEVADVDGVGDQAIEIVGESDINGPTPTNILAIQDGEYLFLVINLGDDTAGVNDDFGKFLVDAEPVDTEVEFSDDGTSTGGFFDMLPQEGDPLIEGMMPMMDMDFLGSSSSTPTT